MKKPEIINKSIFFLLLSSIIGLLAGQLWGAFWVAKSNGQLLLEQEAIARLGFIAVPGEFLFSEIKNIYAHWAGGLFFALSIGLGYGFFCGFFFWIFSWAKTKVSHYIRFIPFIILMVGGIWLNRGTDVSVRAFFLFVPLLVWLLSFRFLPGWSFSWAEAGRHLLLLIAFLSLLVSLLLHSPFVDQDNYSIDFIEIRDRLLLPTTFGQKVDEFYYLYTLYPAQIIKPLVFRLQNIVALETQGFSKIQLSRLTMTLKRYDWFPSLVGEADGSAAQTTLDMNDSGKIMFFFNSKWPKGKRGQTPVYQTTWSEFLENPQEHLTKYSELIFLFEPLRVVCGLSLFIVIPLALILGLFILFLILVRLVCFLAQIKRGGLKETLIMLSIILILFGLINIPGRQKSHLPQEITKLWEIVQGRVIGDRVSALHLLHEILKPESYQVYEQEILSLTRDQDPVVRRFGAELAGKLLPYNESKILPLLKDLLHDRNINVVYTAAESFGKFHTSKTRDILLEIIQGNKPWYLKMKAYNALKNMGWHQ